MTTNARKTNARHRKPEAARTPRPGLLRRVGPALLAAAVVALAAGWWAWPRDRRLAERAKERGVTLARSPVGGLARGAPARAVTTGSDRP
jgi:hypothetical protein